MDLKKLIFIVLAAVCTFTFLASPAISEDKEVVAEGNTYNCPPSDVAVEALDEARIERDKALLKATSPINLDKTSPKDVLTGREGLDAWVDAAQKDTTVKILEECAENKVPEESTGE